MDNSFSLETSHDGSRDFVEICVPEGADFSEFQVLVCDDDGEIEENCSLSPPFGTGCGKNIFLLDPNGKSDFSETYHNAPALVEDGTGLQFVSFEGDIIADEGPASGMVSDVIGFSGRRSSFRSNDLGLTYDVQSSPTPGTLSGPVCFTPGTRISTPQGHVSVEDLREGDLVVTEDIGPQPIRWIHTWTHEFGRGPDPFKPIQIGAGSLPCGGPTEALTVSPLHRVLMSGPIVRQMFGVDEVLAPAKALQPLPGVRRRNGTRRVEYIALMFDKHAVIVAEGASVESFFPGPVAIYAMDKHARSSLFERFPDLETDPESYGDFARPTLTVKQARNLSVSMRACAFPSPDISIGMDVD